ncbi:MAG TPA: hypothetical protein VMG10_21165 [Gemmataceae bacterium]|nr:hypothetical protein [Gemmataceae bacterium]
MTAIVLAQAGEKILLAEKIFAVIGGAVMGGLVVGLLAQLLMRAFTTQKLPRWPLLTVRLIGAVIGGWLVALWVLGGGGAGFGGAGGWGLGSGPGQGDGQQTAEVGKQDGDDKKNGSETRTLAGGTMRIEVLGNAALSESDIQVGRRYRIDTDREWQLLTFAEIKDAIKKRQQEQPPLRRVEMVLYRDSPDKQLPVVSQLRTWASDLNGGKMKVDISQPDADAPRK